MGWSFRDREREVPFRAQRVHRGSGGWEAPAEQQERKGVER